MFRICTIFYCVIFSCFGVNVKDMYYFYCVIFSCFGVNIQDMYYFSLCNVFLFWSKCSGYVLFFTV